MNRSTANIVWVSGLAFVLILLGSITGAGCRTRDAEASSDSATVATAANAAAAVERGRYLVTTNVCNDCHTPWKMGPRGPEPDMSRMLSGHPESVVITRPAPAPTGEWEGSMLMGATLTCSATRRLAPVAPIHAGP
jgi:mono/diheme cytochrome c family protein